MDDEIEDLVGDVKYTDSQKSVATSNVYSLDFTDSCSDNTEKHNSSGKDTYVLEYDSDSSDKTFHMAYNQSVAKLNEYRRAPVKLNNDANIQCEAILKINKSASTSLQKFSILAQEKFTQTSKTIIELAAADTLTRNATNNTLQTQTSFISITENKTVEYSISLCEVNNKYRNKIIHDQLNSKEYYQHQNNSLDDGSSKFPVSETETEITEGNKSDNSSNGEMIRIIEEECTENILSSEHTEESRDSDFDIEEDSLMGNKSPKININHDSNSNLSDVSVSVCNDVNNLYKQLAEHINDRSPERVSNMHERHFNILTPLSEESTVKKDSLQDIKHDVSLDIIKNDELDVIFRDNAGNKIKVLPQEETKTNTFKLPLINKNESCSNSPNLNYLFTVTTPQKILRKAGTLPCLCEGQIDRWEIGTKELASGESIFINGINDSVKVKDGIPQLPHVRIGRQNKQNTMYKNDCQTKLNNGKTSVMSSDVTNGSISIRRRITELKMNNNKSSMYTKTSRSGSPVSISPTESRLGEVAERGCEVLCTELLKRLGSSSWAEVTDTLEETPRVLEKFWGVISEQRVADLIRQVTAHVESPRTQVARTACSTLASIIKNTNYTKKPDFYEAVTILLTKTGSFSRPVRRAANVALDGIVCGVDLTHAVTALCVHGVSHKSPLVRCAAARLLVVCCALGSGGRELLRARPPSAAAARRHALISLAALLDDKNTDTRKYAERLYSMLRPLGHFEAYYLTDVDVELASRQMKKYDRLLLCGPPTESS